MIEKDGSWHERLNELRVQLTRHMDGDVSQKQRELGLDYRVNFGVNMMHLNNLAKDLPKDSSLADVMWEKDIREMKILSLMIRPQSDLTKERAIQLCLETPTTEVAEQLVMLQLRHRDDAEEILSELFEKGLDTDHPSAMIPYLLLLQLVNQKRISLEFMNKLIKPITNALSSENLAFLSTVNNCLIRLAEQTIFRPILIHIASSAIDYLSEDSAGHALALNIKEYLLEQ